MTDRLVVSAAEANRSFARLLAHVRNGARVEITAQGKAVAEIVPHTVNGEPLPKAGAQRAEAGRRLVERLKSQKLTVVGPWTRAKLYERA